MGAGVAGMAITSRVDATRPEVCYSMPPAGVDVRSCGGHAGPSRSQPDRRRHAVADGDAARNRAVDRRALEVELEPDERRVERQVETERRRTPRCRGAAGRVDADEQVAAGAEAERLQAERQRAERRDRLAEA